MQTIELTAKSMDEARKLAAEKLGVEPGTLSITLIEETKGLFGKNNVRVRAEAAEDKKAAPAKTAVTEASVEEPAPAKAKQAKAEAPKGGRKRIGASKTAAAVIEDMQEAVEAPPTPEVVEAIEQAEATPETTANDEETQVVASKEDEQNFKHLLEEILASGDLDVSVKAEATNGRYVNLELDGKDVAFLVGKHGEVLNALQYLVNIAAARKFNNGVRATIDGNNYRQRREAALTDLATKIATEVKARHEEAVLDALPAFERRVVHKALASIDGIETYSEGEEPNRRVVIAPVEA